MEKTEKKNNNLLVFVAIAAAVVFAVAGLLFLFMKNRAEVYRLLKVYDLNGTAKVSREGIGDIEPYANMVLQSGDKVSLDTGDMILLADEDKYIYMEEQTELVLKASGDKNKGKIEIELTKGSITNDIQNKLSDESTYEINTPNSTMSVRGTIYRVSVYEEGGVKYTRVSVFEGKVATRLVFKDGSVADEEVMVEQGKEVIIYEDDKTTNYLSDPKDIEYSSIPEDVLTELKSSNNSGRKTSITNPEIDRVINGPYYVTFTYNEEIFGTQTVEKGERALVPTLKPAQSGSWKFDFNTPIKKDTEIEWK